MPSHLMVSLSALASLLPACLLGPRAARRDRWFWLALALALGGAAAAASVRLGGRWDSGLGDAIWVSIAATLLVFLAVAVLKPAGARLTPLLLPYLVLLGLAATALGDAPARPFASGAPGVWVVAHIGSAVAAFALFTVAACAGVGVTLQERALKAKRPTALTRLLPSVVEGEQLQFRLMTAGVLVLAAAVAAGMAVEWFEAARLLRLDHKSMFAIISLIVVLGLLWAHLRQGLRGRRAARLGLIAYFFLTLAYLGVKFVTDVLLSKA